MSNSKWLSFGLVVLTALASGCSAVKNMQDTTNKVADTSEKISDTSKDIADTSTQIRDVSQDINYEAMQTYLKLRQGNSSDIRLKYFDDLRGEMAIGDDVGKMETKIGDATAYFYGFEFQLADEKDHDDYFDVNKHYLLALQQFSRELAPYVPTDFKVDPTKTDNNAMVLDALAVSMHKVNPLSVPQKFDEKADPRKISMIDLIIHGLKRKQGRNDGTIPYNQQQEWESEVIRNKNDLKFAYLLQVRMNYLPLMLIAQVSKIADGGFLGVPGIIRKVEMLTRDWTPVITTVDEMEYYTRWLMSDDDRGFFYTRQVLKDIGASTELNGTVKSILSHMKINEKSLPPGFFLKDSTGWSPIARFKYAIASVLSGS